MMLATSWIFNRSVLCSSNVLRQLYQLAAPEFKSPTILEKNQNIATINTINTTRNTTFGAKVLQCSADRNGSAC